MDGNIMSFIGGLKKTLSQPGTLTIVMGNQAADLDSIVSALAYSWYLKLAEPQSHPLPLINIPRRDLKLRGEVQYLFTQAGVNPDSLIFLEDVDLEGLRAEGRLKLVLVDHNKLAPGQTGFRDSLVEILDHHEDEKDYPPWVKTEIRPLGSTATLVTEGFLKNHPENLDERLSRLLLGAILLDTANLDPMTGRSTEADRRAAVYLLKKTGIKENPFFDRLEFEKSRISSLGTYDLLRRDYKEWVLGAAKYGISSVPLSLGDWLKKDGAILEGFKKYLEERALDVLLVMNAYRNPNFRRDLAVYAPEEELRKPVINCLKTAGLELESIKTNIGEEEGIDFFHQGNPGFSRKKLHPLLNRLFAG